MSESLIVREYTEADWPRIAEWLDAHASTRVIKGLLPPMGVVVEEAGEMRVALWCHFSTNIGVAFLEAPVSKPGLTLAQASGAFGMALGAVEKICRSLDYNVLIAHTLPPIARYLHRRHGFSREGERVQMVKLLSD